MKKYVFIFFLIIGLSSCQKTKNEIANNLVEKSFKAMQETGEEVEIIKIDSLTPARLTFDETSKGVKMQQSINQLREEISEKLKFLKTWAGVANTKTELQEVNEKISLMRHLEDSLIVARSHFKFDTTMVMKSIIIKRKDQGQLITDTAYIFFDKLVTKCIGIKAKDEGAYQYIPMSSMLPND